jgi:hypothetical protein
MIIAAVGTWYGGWVDELIQRITEINLVLPFLSILVMVGTFYSRSIWVILGVTVLLSIFTGSIKSYRAIFLQVKESMYIEAARAYGASDFRIIFQYRYRPSFFWKLRSPCWVWAIRSCRHGARSSTMRMRMGRSIKVIITGSWNRPRC